MELEELRARIRDWKLTSQGVAPSSHEIRAAVRPVRAELVRARSGRSVDVDADLDTADTGEQAIPASRGFDETESMESIPVGGRDARSESNRPASETASRLGVEFTVPEGESTAEILVPGEDGFDPEES